MSEEVRLSSPPARGDSFMTSNTDVIWANRTAKAILLIRILVGWVFLSEGIQKFLFPESLGVGPS
jgi:hypothetical protein